MNITQSSRVSAVLARSHAARYGALTAAVGAALLAAGWILVGHLPHSPLWVAATRVLPAGLLLLALRPQLPAGKWWFRSLALGSVNIAGFFVLQAVAVHHIPAGVAATIASTQALLVPLGAVVLLRTPMRGARLAYASTGVIGVALLVERGQDSHMHPAGAGAAAGMAVCSAVGLLLTRRWGQPSGAHHFATTGWQLVAGGVVLLPVAMLVESPLPPGSGGSLTITVALAATTAAGFGALFGPLHAGLPATTVSRLMLLCPILVAATGWLFYQQSLSALQVMGAVLVVLPVAAACRPVSVGRHRAPTATYAHGRHHRHRHRNRRRSPRYSGAAPTTSVALMRYYPEDQIDEPAMVVSIPGELRSAIHWRSHLRHDRGQPLVSHGSIDARGPRGGPE